MNMINKVCPCGCGLDNMSEALIERLRQLEIISGMSLILTSGSRCAKHNAQIKGARNSAHLRGLAADVACRGSLERWNILVAATTMGITRIGCGDTFVHLDIDPSLPAQRVWLY